MIQLHGKWSTIGGGLNNSIKDIPGPSFDLAWFNTIAGGESNKNDGDMACAIGGGFSNIIADSLSYSDIAGGSTDTILTSTSTIGGGLNNTVDGISSAIAGGEGNRIYQYDGYLADHSFIGGGLYNEIRSEWDVIGGGQSNMIDVDVFGTKWGFIGGGENNYEGPGGEWNVICGGDSNLNNGGTSFMGGGQGNQIYNELAWSTLVGGSWNFVGNIVTNNGPDYASLVGGRSDSVAAEYASMGGGQNNTITATADHATIPGGDSLIAISYAETVVGYNNDTVGAVSKATAMTGVAGTALDPPLFVVGNGKTSGSRSNAFQVSYDGHTTVSDINGGSGTARANIYGSSYQDNIIVAWAVITNATPNPITHIVSTSTDFGVDQITSTIVGVYNVTLNVKERDGTTNQPFAGGAVLVTPMDPVSGTFCGRSIIATPVSGTPGAFTITIRDGSCNGVVNPFMFQVVGR